MTVKAADLLDYLKKDPLFDSFHLTLYRHPDEFSSGFDLVCPLCGIIKSDSLCDRMCQSAAQEAVQRAIQDDQPKVFRCPTGLLNFAVPFRSAPNASGCLIGGGVREKSMTLAQLEALSNAESADGKGLLDRLDKLPFATQDEIAGKASEIHRLLPKLMGNNLHEAILEKTTDRLRSISEVTRGIDRLTDPGEILSLLGESLVVLFDFPRIAVLLSDRDRRHVAAQYSLGFQGRGLEISEKPISDFLRRSPAENLRLKAEEVQKFFPGLAAQQVLGIPLSGGSGEPFGLLAIFDSDLHYRDTLLIELLTGKAAARIDQLQLDQEKDKEKAQTGRLLEMISTLSLVDSSEELYRHIIHMAAELLDAASGSLMLVDKSGENLRIEAAKGMNLPLARSMNVKIGTGISGKVAKSGFHLLVNDIERDSRVAMANRPRFRTKSFISFPLKVKGATIGVLNLADKETGDFFTESDLNLLLPLVTHSSVMIERATAMERASLLEELSVTDPLTGLYNRRFLEKRLEEELGRSSRQKLNFTVMLIDLDHFKIYNDLCGHIAGDSALKKTAELLRSSAREMDIVTRFGGEEFCVVLPGTSIKEAVAVGERIRRAVENEPFPQEKSLPLKRLTASIGISAFPENGNTPRNLVNAADVALYKAKTEGRNRLVTFDPSMMDRQQENKETG